MKNGRSFLFIALFFCFASLRAAAFDPEEKCIDSPLTSVHRSFGASIYRKAQAELLIRTMFQGAPNERSVAWKQFNNSSPVFKQEVRDFFMIMAVRSV